MLELDPNLQALILAGVTYLVVEGLKSLGGVFGIDLSGAGAAVTAAVMAVVLASLSGLLAWVPVQYHEVAQVVMSLIVVIFGSFGAHGIVKKNRAAKSLV